MGSILGLLGLGGGSGGGGASGAMSSASVSNNNTNTSGGGLNIWEIALAIVGLLIIGLFLTLHKK